MWPVQTLTLLLCLTDDEQLFAQKFQEPETTVVEVVLDQANGHAEEGSSAHPFGNTTEDEVC